MLIFCTDLIDAAQEVWPAHFGQVSQVANFSRDPITKTFDIVVAPIDEAAPHLVAFVEEDGSSWFVSRQVNTTIKGAHAASAKEACQQLKAILES